MKGGVPVYIYIHTHILVIVCMHSLVVFPCIYIHAHTCDCLHAVTGAYALIAVGFQGETLVLGFLKQKGEIAPLLLLVGGF